MNELSERLEIKSSQQEAWNEYANLISMIEEQQVKKTNDDSDSVNISPCKAERETEFLSKLSRIADATSKFKAVLTEEQQKILHVFNFEWIMLHGRR